MIVDDRLETVLRTVAAGKAGIRTQYRQLADLLGRTGSADWTDAHDDALDRLDSLHGRLGDEAGAALLRSCALRSPLLVRHFAHRGPKAALAAIAHARLDEAEWVQMIPGLPVQARGFLRHRRDLGPKVEQLLDRLGIDDFVLPLPEGYVALASAPLPHAVATPAVQNVVELPTTRPFATPGEADGIHGHDGIGAIVRRIEAFRKQRDAQPAIALPAERGQSRLPFADEAVRQAPPIVAVDIRIDADGTICAADAALAPMLVGARPFTGEIGAPAACDANTLRAARSHLPIEAGLLTLEGAAAIAGPWRIDAAPDFARDGGHFLGYHARLRRPQAPALAAAVDEAVDTDRGADRLRQLLHELRTPINAIQGFAEVIQQQLFGPTPHQYRSLAASIASEAARMLAGFEEVERLALLETGTLDAEPGEADVTATLQKLVAQLEPMIGPREIRLRCALQPSPVTVAMAPAELERILWRLLSVMAGSAAPGERLAIVLTVEKGRASLLLTLPAALALRDDDTLFAPDGKKTGADARTAMLGNGFALRLAAAEMRAAGGTLVRQGAQLSVSVPLLTDSRRPPSQGHTAAAGMN
jgi:signal transduction histidine kinase